MAAVVTVVTAVVVEKKETSDDKGYITMMLPIVWTTRR